ncbi:hypothetical protein QFZ30_002266 [Arthrobacter pascens]|uniref:hypothetical protein n=1 Tax=Arthrobacter pascens TaxID=1677 RepID=UPI0027915150|nr:hypothetical protein [Arthrobacter pascens]MDQ0678884.1 hypothetical protein [Arthrobacter pascens]
MVSDLFGRVTLEVTVWSNSLEELSLTDDEASLLMRMSSAAAQQRPVPLDEQVIAKHGIGGLWCDSRRNRQWSSVAIAAVTIVVGCRKSGRWPTRAVEQSFPLVRDFRGGSSHGDRLG